MILPRLGPQRPLQLREIALIEKLLQTALDDGRYSAETLDTYSCREYIDNSAGSILLEIPGEVEGRRKFGAEIARASITDSDGTFVSITLNVDPEGKLYELDIWRVDDHPLVHWPNANELVIEEVPNK